jgi:hypothetical protein
VTVVLDEVQKNSEDDLGLKFSMSSFDKLASKGLFHEKTVVDGAMVTKFKFEELAQLSTYWSIIYTIQTSVDP